jgi:hypothetical protein
MKKFVMTGLRQLFLYIKISLNAIKKYTIALPKSKYLVHLFKSLKLSRPHGPA